MIIQFIVEHVDPMDGVALSPPFEDEADAWTFAGQDYIKNGTVYPLHTYENKGQMFNPPQFPRYQKQGDFYVDTQTPLSTEQAQTFASAQEDEARAKIYAGNDSLVIPVLRAQMFVIDEKKRAPFLEQWDIMAAMPAEYKGAEIAKLYKMLAALDAKTKIDSFKELERRRTEIRAKTKIDISSMIGGA